MSENMPLGCSLVIIGALFAGAAGVGIAKNMHEERPTCTITAKESTSKGESGHEYRIFTEQCGVLVAKDSLWRMHFAAADVYGGLEVGETYDLITTGWRVPFLSWMPNIVEATPAK